MFWASSILTGWVDFNRKVWIKLEVHVSNIVRIRRIFETFMNKVILHI